MFLVVKSNGPKIYVPKQSYDSSAITEYVQSCFYKASSSSIDYLGKQGAVLYYYQAYCKRKD